MCFYFRKSSYNFLSVLLLLLFSYNLHAQTFSIHPRFLQVGPNPWAIATADLNGDNIPDIVTADRGEMRNPREEKPANDELSILLSQGVLDYIKLHPSPKTDFAPYALAIANMDSLKWLDIVVVNFLAKKNQDIQIFHNLKEENIFTASSIKIPDDNLKYTRLTDGDEQPLFTTPGLTSLIVTDLNKDGLNDVITTGWSSDIVAVLFGDSKEKLVLHQVISTPGGPRALTMSDLDNDNYPDLIVTMFNSGELLFLKGNNEFIFNEYSRLLTRGSEPNHVAIADFNADGKHDIVVSHRKLNQPVEILYGDGQPFSFRLSNTFYFNSTNPEINTEIMDMLVADFNNDHLPDIALADRKGQQLIVMLNKGKGEQTEPTTTRKKGKQTEMSVIQEKGTMQPNNFAIEKYPIKSGNPVALATADFNQDGFLDIVISTQNTNEIIFFLNNQKK